MTTVELKKLYNVPIFRGFSARLFLFSVLFSYIHVYIKTYVGPFHVRTLGLIMNAIAYLRCHFDM